MNAEHNLSTAEKCMSIIDKECSTIKQLRFLFDVCSQIECLTINIAEANEDIIISFLFSKIKKNNYRIISQEKMTW